MSFAVGSLVKARGREWVVLPESNDELLILRPLGGTDDEVTGVLIPLEKVEHAQFDLPDPSRVGDYRSCRMLRDAIRLGFRSSAGPFRSFAKLAVEPRPYQLVPLLMALKLDPVRLLIADDVGIGKTIEALLVVRELLDRGEIQRIAVLCPPHLAEQWQSELNDKFHINAEVVLAGTAKRLERNCALNESIFEKFQHVIVSLDFIKSDRRRDEFIRTCPELVIIDEAHTCTFSGVGKGGRHQRHDLIKRIASDPNKNIILVTATPHSGKEDAFRELLTFLKPEFKNLPQDLSGQQSEKDRRDLAQYFVQRRRADIRAFMKDTKFPDRLEREESYKLSPEYKKLFQKILAYAREIVRDPETNKRHQRVKWWSALALLRSMASSPEAAIATLRNRASTIDAETPEDADEIGRRTVLDLEDDEDVERMDIAPGADISDLLPDDKHEHRKLLDLAREAEKLRGDDDTKLQDACKFINALIKDGFHPIVFCRFIPTVDYLADELRKKLKGVEVAGVTGKLPPEEREYRVEQLSKSDKRVLVCTDCLSEGVNLQGYFDAVIHYDLSWNPTRHEQREGRVDRFGQSNPKVRVITYYGTDNQIDGIVLDVLIRKHKAIRSSLGISVPVPVNTNTVLEAILEGLLLRGEQGLSESDQLLMFEDLIKPQKDELYKQWDNVTEKEKKSRTMFAQQSIKVDEVARELESVQQAIGVGADVSQFMTNVVKSYGGFVTEKSDGVFEFDLTETPSGFREMIPLDTRDMKFKAKFELPVTDSVIYLSRTHPIVESTANYVFNTAIDPISESISSRSGVIRTSDVDKRTVLLLLRFRYHIIFKKGNKEVVLLAEDCQVTAFSGSPQNPEWLPTKDAEKLMELKPVSNTPPDIAQAQLEKILCDIKLIEPELEKITRLRGQVLLDAHLRVRKALKYRKEDFIIEPKLPPDVLGIYIYLPKPEDG